MSYAIFRCKGIKTLNDLGQIGSHNKRSKESYKSNPDIRKEDSKNNIDLIKCDKGYKNRFYEITKEYQDEYNGRMKNIRPNRRKSFSSAVDKSKSVVADEMIFTSDEDFFQKLSKEEILKWANESLNFVYEDLGYKKEQVIHATLHLDEKVPHIHLVVVPLVKRFDKRATEERWCIAKNYYVKDKIHLSILQDKYYSRLIRAGFDLERGEKDTGISNLTMKQLKGVVKYFDRQLYYKKQKLNNEYYQIKSILKRNKKKLFNSNKIVLDGEDYEILTKHIDMYYNDYHEILASQALYNELANYTYTYKELERNYISNKYSLDNMTIEYDILSKKFNTIKLLMDDFTNASKPFFRDILLSKDNKYKNQIINILKNGYKENLYTYFEIKEIIKDTDIENEIEDFINNLSLEKDYDLIKES